MEKMKVYSQEEMLDMTLGKVGTPERNEYEAEVNDYLVGLATRRAREAQCLTLGNGRAKTTRTYSNHLQ